VLATEHRRDVRLQPTGIGQVEQQRKRFVGDALLGVIQVESGALGGEALA
jgi:hypothetical protein